MSAKKRKQRLRSEQAARLSLALPERAAAVALKNGQRVSLYVRSVNSDGTARVQVAGADITAKSEMPRGFLLQAGQVLKGRVFFEEGKVYIRLAQPAEQRSSFARLLASSGIAPSESAYRALELFYASGMRIDPPALRQALTLAAAFTGREARAAEAAVLLLHKGLPLNKETLDAALAIIEGKALQDDAFSARESALRINPDGKGDRRQGQARGESQRKDAGEDAASAHAGGGEGSKSASSFWLEFTGQNLQYNMEDNCAKPAWFILPFKRDFAGTECTGSIRFLASSLRGRAIETRVTALSSFLGEEGAFSADFVLTESGCRFALAPEPQGRRARRLCAELAKALEGAGLASNVEFGAATAAAEFAPVDIEI